MKETILTIGLMIVLTIAAVACSNLSGTKQVGDEIEMDISEIEFEGHTYLVFGENGKSVSVVHDPNCECHKEE